MYFYFADDYFRLSRPPTLDKMMNAELFLFKSIIKGCLS